MQGIYGRITTIALVAVALAASTAQAQEPPPAQEPAPAEEPDQTEKARAQGLVEAATELYNQQQYSQALELYRQAYRHYASPVIIMNIGSTLLNLGHTADAANAYQAVLRHHRRDQAQDPVIRDILLKQLAPSLARIRVDVPAEDIESVSISVDGKVFDGPASSEIWVEPGTRSLTVTWPDGSARPLTVQARAGQLHELAAARPAADTQGSPGQTIPLVVAPAGSARPPGREYRIAFWASAAATGAAFGGGLVLTQSVRQLERDKLAAIQASGVTLDEGDACVDAEAKMVTEVVDICQRGQARALGANILFAAGWAGAAAAGFLLYKGYIAPPSTAEQSTALIAPTVTPTTVGAQLTWMF